MRNMKTFELSDEEFEILKDLFSDHGSDCPYTDSNKLQALGEKFGILEPIQPPTEEELKRREEFRNSPFGLMMSKMLVSINMSIVEDILKPNALIENFGKEGAKIGSTLKIKLPNDYTVGN